MKYPLTTQRFLGFTLISAQGENAPAHLIVYSRFALVLQFSVTAVNRGFLLRCDRGIRFHIASGRLPHRWQSALGYGYH